MALAGAVVREDIKSLVMLGLIVLMAAVLLLLLLLRMRLRNKKIFLCASGIGYFLSD